MSRFDARNPDYAEQVRQSFARQAFMAHIGAELVAVSPGRCEIGLAHRPELTQQHGYFHAGVVSAIADTAGGYAAFSLMPAGASVLTVEFKINLVAPADGELLVARGQVLKPGRTLTVCRLTVDVVHGGEHKTCALGQQTVFTLRDTPDGPRPK